jgi:hypothetical protein
MCKIICCAGISMFITYICMYIMYIMFIMYITYISMFITYYVYYAGIRMFISYIYLYIDSLNISHSCLYPVSFEKGTSVLSYPFIYYRILSYLILSCPISSIVMITGGRAST